jgi:hypothetical protein
MPKFEYTFTLVNSPASILEQLPNKPSILLSRPDMLSVPHWKVPVMHMQYSKNIKKVR